MISVRTIVVNDQELMKQLEKICENLTNRFRTSLSYSSKDLMSDVIERVVKGLSQFRHDSKLTSWLRGIAYNRMIDVYRKPGNKAPSMDSLKFQSRNGEECERDGEQIEGGEPAERFVETNRNHVEDRRVRSILLNELMGMLSPQERLLLSRYFVEGFTMQEIADTDGRSKQAVSNQLSRVLKKLRKASGLNDS